MAENGGYTSSLLSLEHALQARPVLQGNALGMRAQFNGLVEALKPQYPSPSPAVQATEADVEHLKLRIYSPKELLPGASLPVGVFSHAGGFVIGNLDSEDPLCRAIVENAGVVVVSADYRLAPEYKSPAQLEDVLTALHWVWHNASVFHGDRDKIFTIGTSAGAGLALSVTRTTLLGHQDLPKNIIKGVVALAPVTLHPDYVPAKLQDQYLSYNENVANVPIIEKASMDEFFASVKVQPTDPNYFVALDEDIQSLFPPTYVVTCEFDPLRDDGIIFVGSLQSKGMQVMHDHYRGLPHCFWIFPKLPETQSLLESLLSGIEWVLARN